MLPSAPIGVAVLGLGRMGLLFARLVARLGPAARLVALADPNPIALAAAQRDLPDVRAAADPLAVLGWPEVDAVLVATPTRTHAELVTAAASLGKPVFCEKPLALTLAETRATVEAVERAGVPLQVGFMRRFDPPYVQAQALLASGQLGRRLTFKAIGRDPFCPPAAYADPATSGGLLVDMAIHDFDLARWLMGSEVEQVAAQAALLVCDEIGAVGDVDNAIVDLRFASGALGSVEVSRNAAYGYDIRTEVLGSEGVVLVGGDGVPNPPGSRLVTRGRADVNRATFLEERFGDAYRAEIEHFVACVRHGRQPSVGGADALAAIRIASAATQALQVARPVALADLDPDPDPDPDPEAEGVHA